MGIMLANISAVSGINIFQGAETMGGAQYSTGELLDTGPRSPPSVFETVCFPLLEMEATIPKKRGKS